jgi:hypothetical protein
VVEHTPSRPLPWRRLLVLAALGTFCAFAYAVLPILDSPWGVATVIVPGDDGPAAALLQRDFPTFDFHDAAGHDGQQFYALAREPMHLDQAADSLDRPHYRAQRILLPALAWLLHPSGGGIGLVVALVSVGLLGLFGGAVAFGALSATLGGRAEIALLFPVLPGALVSLGATVPDALALGLALAAITLDLRDRPHAAIVAAIGAVLAKESLFLVVLGYALWRRDARGARLAAIPALVAGTWWAVVRVLVDAGGVDQVLEFQPLRGLWFALGYYLRGEDPEAALVFALAVGLAMIGFRRGALRGPLGLAVALQLGFLTTLSPPVLAIWANGERATLPLLALGILVVAARPPFLSRIGPTGADSAQKQSHDETGSVDERVEVRRPLGAPASAR